MAVQCAVRPCVFGCTLAVSRTSVFFVARNQLIPLGKLKCLSSGNVILLLLEYMNSPPLVHGREFMYCRGPVLFGVKKPIDCREAPTFPMISMAFSMATSGILSSMIMHYIGNTSVINAVRHGANRVFPHADWLPRSQPARCEHSTTD